MKQYIDYTPEELADDSSFRNWVLNPQSPDANFWQSWISKNPEKSEVVKGARELVLMLSFQDQKVPPSYIRNDWERLQASIRESQPVARRKFAFPAYARWVASIAFILVASALIFYASQQSVPQMLSYSTSFGETREIVLPDGSGVILNANSEISFSPEWQPGMERKVSLQGEAYFDVRHLSNPERSPFRVHTGNMTVQVLGTKFNVTDRNGDTRVVLNSGKVQLSHPQSGDTLIMAPGEMAELPTKSTHFVTRRVNPEVYSAWTQNRWIFEQTPIATIAKRIESTYGVEVVVEGTQLLNRELSGSLRVESLDFLLSALSTSFEIDITREEDRIVLRDGS